MTGSHARAATAAVIGCGNISRFHFEGLRNAGATVSWACDPNAEAARAKAGTVPGCRATTDYREALVDPAVRLVVVAAPSRLHRQICLAAVAAGKTVVCEKTLAENPTDAAAIVRAARQAGTVFYTSYMKRFIPAVGLAKRLLPTIGPVVAAHARVHQCWGDLWSGPPTDGFFHTPADGPSPVRRNYGGGILVCGGSHMLDLVLFLLGRPRRVYADVHVPAGRDYDLRASAMLQTATVSCHFEALAHGHDRIGFLRDGWDERIEMIGTRGRIELMTSQWDAPHTKASLLRHYDASTRTWTEHPGPAVSPFDAAAANYWRAALENRQLGVPVTSGYDVDELIAALTRSGNEGRAVDVEWQMDELPAADADAGDGA